MAHNSICDFIDNLAPLKNVLAEHGIYADKKFGQNFLLDLNITRKIVRLANLEKGAHIFEIGPGPGGLTRALCETAAHQVTVIEKDPRFIPLLQDLQSALEQNEQMPQLEIIEGDALDQDVTALGQEKPLYIVANLPYNVATPLLTGWLYKMDQIDAMALMFQKEVAERIIAKPNHKDYGRLSVISQLLSTPKKLMDLPPSAFTPPPKVRSSVVQFKPHDNVTEHLKEAPILEKITALAFGQRRKMLRRSLKPLLNKKPDILELADIDESLRAEAITPELYLKLARLVREHGLSF